MDRVETFRMWRKIVKSNPKKFRIKIHQLCGGFAFSFEELTFTKKFQQSLFCWQGDVMKTYGFQMVYKPVWDWNIIAHTNLWTPSLGDNVIRFKSG